MLSVDLRSLSEQRIAVLDGTTDLGQDVGGVDAAVDVTVDLCYGQRFTERQRG